MSIDPTCFNPKAWLPLEAVRRPDRQVPMVNGGLCMDWYVPRGGTISLRVPPNGNVWLAYEGEGADETPGGTLLWRRHDCAEDMQSQWAACCASIIADWLSS